jgi:hypothetical protein
MNPAPTVSRTKRNARVGFIVVSELDRCLLGLAAVESPDGVNVDAGAGFRGGSESGGERRGQEKQGVHVHE